MPDVKLAIGLPVPEGSIDVRFFDSFVTMQKPYDWEYMRPTFPCNFPGTIDDARNSLVQQAFESDCTHLLMLDTDQKYPVDTIPRLFAHNKPIVRAKVHRRYPPFDPILLRTDPETGCYAHIPDSEWIGGGLIRVDATGVAACGLFNMEVFENVPAPWFETVRRKLNDGTATCVGEDVRFCEKARASGYEIWVDCDLQVEHLAIFSIGTNFYNLYKAATGSSV